MVRLEFADCPVVPSRPIRVYVPPSVKVSVTGPLTNVAPKTSSFAFDVVAVLPDEAVSEAPEELAV